MSAAGRLGRLRRGGKAAFARALAELEAAPEAAENVALLDAAWSEGRGRVLGLTGPPGVGKSTLVSTLVRRFRSQRLTVAVIAVDPSSPTTGGALLGDRTRLDLDPDDAGTFVRSMAARDRLGGLATFTYHAVVLARVLYDRVIVETVGVGQSETEIRGLADVVLLAVQPAAGDTLQFMKAGILEIPDLVVVTKADLGDIAERAGRELRAALRHGGPAPAEVHLASAVSGAGVDELFAAIEDRLSAVSAGGEGEEPAWLGRLVADRYGRVGLDRFRGFRPADPGAGPFRRLAEFAALFEASLPTR